jgi:hypothetical protein
MLSALILLALYFAPQKTDPTLPPSSAHLAYTVEGRGVQIYRCTEQDSAFTWVFQSPEATLFDPSTHQRTGTHSAGPTWAWKDGSAITSKVLEKSSSPDPLSIPWLLLAATPSGATKGALSKSPWSAVPILMAATRPVRGAMRNTTATPSESATLQPTPSIPTPSSSA